MDFTLDDNTHAQVLKLRHFIKNELQPMEDEVEAMGGLDLKKLPLKFLKNPKAWASMERIS